MLFHAVNPNTTYFTNKMANHPRKNHSASCFVIFATVHANPAYCAGVDAGSTPR
jgi:hypothetical protein